jgi:quercetin dioxygenase-like cupin family protein
MYDIQSEIRDLGFDGLQVKKVVSGDSLEILVISLEKGSQFPEHISPRDAHLIVLEGAIDFNINNKIFHIHPMENFNFPGNTKHHVRAGMNSKFLIIR